MRKLMFLMGFMFLVSCGQDLTQTSRSGSSSQSFSAATCSCTDHNDPVCGNLGNQYVTFLNSCIAQCNGYEFSSGVCSPTLNASCNQASGQVCGQPPMPECPDGLSCVQSMPAPQIYSNECEMVAARATGLTMNNCE